MFTEFRYSQSIDEAPGARQISSLVYCMGAVQAKKIMKTFKYEKIQVPKRDGNGTEEFEEKEDQYDTVVKKFTSHFVPKRNIIHERFVFHSRSQLAKKADGSTETIEEFVRELQTLVQTCGYSDTEEQVRDRFVLGLRNRSVTQRLNMKADLTLDYAVTYARQAEQVKEHEDQQQGLQQSSINEVRGHGRARGNPNRGRGNFQRGRNSHICLHGISP